MFSSTSLQYGFDSEGKYDGTKKFFWSYHERLMTTLETAGAKWIIGKTLLPPFRPRAAMEKYNNNEDLTDQEYRQVEKYTEKLMKNKRRNAWES
jgi:hypothetical protein